MVAFPNFNTSTNSTPTTSNDGNIIATFNPATFDVFIKVLNILQDNEVV